MFGLLSHAHPENASAPSVLRLSEVGKGESVVIETIDCDRSVRRRLLEMGLLPGTRALVIGRAPLGDPIRLQVREYVLSIRLSEAAVIRVSRVSASAQR